MIEGKGTDCVVGTEVICRDEDEAAEDVKLLHL